MMLSLACTSSASMMVKYSRQELSLAWSEKISSTQENSRNSKLLLMNQAFTTRMVPMIRCCSRISFRNSYFMSSISQQSQTLRWFILHVFFQNQRLHQLRKRYHPQQKDLQNHFLQTFRFKPPPDIPQPHQIKRRVTGKQAPSEFEINMINSIKEGILEINEKSIDSDQSEVDQELQLLQGLRHQECYQTDLPGFSKKEIKETIKKELISLSSSGH